MAQLIDRLLADTQSGVKTDSDGRRYFRPRRVSFETVYFDIDELHGQDWLTYNKVLTPLPWDENPSHKDIREFAQESSERFIAFWYRVFDVALARALAGRDREIFRKAFLRPSPLMDIGIPREQTQSSVPPGLHQKILKEYNESQAWQSPKRIYYLSNYLEGLTRDTTQILRPYSALWDLKNRRKYLLREIRQTADRVANTLLKRDAALQKNLEAQLDAELLARLDELGQAKAERRIADALVRKLIHRRRGGDLHGLTEGERRSIFLTGEEFGPPEAARRIYAWLNFADGFYRQAESAAMMSSSAYRLGIRICRLNYLHRRFGLEIKAESVNSRRRHFQERFQKRMDELSPAALATREEKLLERFARLRRLSRMLKAGANPEALRNEIHNGPPPEPDLIQEARTADFRELSNYHQLLSELETVQTALLRIYGEAHLPPLEEEESTAPPLDPRYPGREQLELPEDVSLEDPYQENQVLTAARELILKRLRPVRRTSNFYSLIPEHRHGAMTLNPIMKLWKDRPGGTDPDLPPLTHQELNTRQTVSCLLELAQLADPGLATRSVQRGRIAKIGRMEENLESMLFFLLPGSCYPLREVNRFNFPEFRGRVIGENRNSRELGVPVGEEAVLTGGWYKKANHSLYYPVGGDNNQLLRTILVSGRSPGPPAFFFGLGQFIHDCLPDNQIYFRSMEKTFRECVEEYYRLEDNIRKNRGERFGRRKKDNSRDAIRFMFAVNYSRTIMENLTGSSQALFRHPPTESWLEKNLGITSLLSGEKDYFRKIRKKVREIIYSYS